VSLSIASLSRATLTNAQWDHASQNGPVWVVPGDALGN